MSKRKASSRTKTATAIKVSLDILKILQHRRKRKPKLETYDSVLRRVLGIPSKTGEHSQRKVFWVLTKPQIAIFHNPAEARGQAILNAIRMKARRAEKPLEVMEVT
jgi:hypothetical protein